ncbi:MAG TPA: haloacid dehalogenase-like hydrolase [Luteitalea sp.]|nr:haloacid dehalogenase-like hydrolase [Luteitalea sp.]
MGRRARPTRPLPGAILYDLDGTLIRGDLARWFLLDSLKRHPIRAFAALLAAPFVLPLFKSSRLRRYATTTFFWIATVGRRPREVLREFRHFARRFVAGGGKLRAPAIAQLRRHASGTQPVAIVTGCASPLAHAFVLALGLPGVRVVGSVAGWKAGGFVVHLHCYGAKKVPCAVGAGVPPPWAACYTDSAKDLPLLERASTRVLVCPSPETLDTVRAALGDTVRVETWN